MSFVATAIVGSAAIGGAAGIYSANKAASAQTAAAQAAIASQQQMFGKAQEQLQPFIDFGQGNLGTLKNLLTPGANMNDTLEQMPGFKFAYDWGQKGITNQATSSGKGGNALQAGSKFAEGLAQNSYGTIVDNLLKSAGIGQGAASSLASGAIQTGQGIAGSQTGIGNAQAGANIAEGNAVSGLGNSISNAFTLNALTGGKLFGGGGGMYGNGKGIGGP